MVKILVEVGVSCVFRTTHNLEITYYYSGSAITVFFDSGEKGPIEWTFVFP